MIVGLSSWVRNLDNYFEQQNSFERKKRGNKKLRRGYIYRRLPEHVKCKSCGFEVLVVDGDGCCEDCWEVSNE